MIPDKSKDHLRGRRGLLARRTMRKWKERFGRERLQAFDFPIHTPFHELTQEQKRLLWRGNEYFHGLDDFSPTSTRNAARFSSA